MTSEAYPYNLSSYPDVDPPIPGNPCVFDEKKVVPGTQKFFTFATGRAPTEDQMAAFIHHNGPVSAGIGSDVFGLREKGCEARGDCFINATACAAANEIDHSITVVGYGTDPVRGDYCACKAETPPLFTHCTLQGALILTLPPHTLPPFSRDHQKLVVGALCKQWLHQRAARRAVRRHVRRPLPRRQPVWHGRPQNIL